MSQRVAPTARDFSDVRAVVEACIRLFEVPDAIGGIFNLRSGQAFSLREIIAMACRIPTCEIEIEAYPPSVRANEVKLLWASREK